MKIIIISLQKLKKSYIKHLCAIKNIHDKWRESHLSKLNRRSTAIWNVVTPHSTVRLTAYLSCCWLLCFGAYLGGFRTLSRCFPEFIFGVGSTITCATASKCLFFWILQDQCIPHFFPRQSMSGIALWNESVCVFKQYLLTLIFIPTGIKPSPF